MFLLWLRQLPQCGDRTPASVPPPAEGRSSPTNIPVFPPSSFILPSFAWFYIFFSAGQVLPSTLSWCSACTSVSEGVFLMYLWERRTPRPPTPPPSCSLTFLFLPEFDQRKFFFWNNWYNSFYFYNFLILATPHSMWDLVSWPGIASALAVWSPNHWTSKEVPGTTVNCVYNFPSYYSSEDESLSIDWVYVSGAEIQRWSQGTQRLYLVIDPCKPWCLWAWPTWSDMGLLGLLCSKLDPDTWDIVTSCGRDNQSQGSQGSDLKPVWYLSFLPLEGKWENTGYVNIEYFKISKLCFYHVIKCLFPRALLYSLGGWCVLLYQFDALMPRGQASQLALVIKNLPPNSGDIRD